MLVKQGMGGTGGAEYGRPGKGQGSEKRCVDEEESWW